MTQLSRSRRADSPVWLRGRRSLLLLVLGLSAFCPATAQGNAELTAYQAKQIEAAVAAHMPRYGIPAISLAIVHEGQIRYKAAFGKIDLENSIPASVSSAFRIASVSKPITAVAAMQLAESGVLDLDAPVQKYVPGFPLKEAPITTRQLLAHLSGIRHYNPGEGERTVRYDSITDALSVFKDDPLKHSPGARYTYSTFGYTLLGAVIEAASGMKFVDYMAHRIFQPAGMLRTQVDDVFLIMPDRARGYSPRVYAVFDGSLRNPVLMDPSYKIPGGGFLSTAEDLARFAIALQEGKLVKGQTFREMATSARTNDGTETRYGYGWYIGRPGRPADRSIWHGGVQAGFTADLLLLPDKRFALVMLTNLEGGGGLRLSQLADQIIKIVLEESPKPSARR